MSTLIKILMVLVPLIIIVGGVVLIIQAGGFWLDTIGPPNIEQREFDFDRDTPFEATLFAPEIIRPQDSPISVEVEVNQVGELSGANGQVVVTVSDDCDYIRVDNAKSTLSFSADKPRTQSTIALLNVRQTWRPPTRCGLQVTIVADQAQAVEAFSLPVNAWLGHLVAIGKLLLGVVVSVLSLRGLLAVFGV